MRNGILIVFGFLGFFLTGCMTAENLTLSVLPDPEIVSEPAANTILEDPVVASRYPLPPTSTPENVVLILPSTDSIHRHIKALLSPEFPQVAFVPSPLDVQQPPKPSLLHLPEVFLPPLPEVALVPVEDSPEIVPDTTAEPAVTTVQAPEIVPVPMPVLALSPDTAVGESPSRIMTGSLVEPATIRAPRVVQVLPPMTSETPLSVVPVVTPVSAVQEAASDTPAPPIPQNLQTLQIFPNQTLTLRLEGFGWILDFIRTENGEADLEYRSEYGASGMSYILVLPERPGSDYEIGFIRTSLSTGDIETQAFEVQVVEEIPEEAPVASLPSTQFLEVNYEPEAPLEVFPPWVGLSPDAQLYYRAQDLEKEQTSSSIRQAIGLYRELLNSYPLSDYYIDAGNRIRFLERHYVMVR